MAPSSRTFLAAAALAVSAAGCIITSTETAGAPCTRRDECTQANYDCLPDPAQDGGKSCQLIFPPPLPGTDAGADAGVDGGPVPTVFFCGQVEQDLKTFCGKCHGADRSLSGNLPFRLDVYDDIDGGSAAGGLDGAKTKAPRIRVRLTDPLFPPMPPVGEPQPDATTRQRIVNWVLSGAQFCDGGM